MNTVDIVGTTALTLFTIGVVIMAFTLVKSALLAKHHSRRLIWSGAAILAGLLLALNLGNYARLSSHERMDSVIGQISDDQKALKPLVKNAGMLAKAGEKLAETDNALVAIHKDIGELKNLVTKVDNRLTESITNTVAGLKDGEARIQRLEAMARTGTAPQPLIGDRAFVQLAPLPQVLPPIPQLETAAPQTQAPPVAQTQPNFREQLQASWGKRLDDLAKQNRKGVNNAMRTSTQAEKTAAGAQQIAQEASRQAKAAEIGYELNSDQLRRLEVRMDQNTLAVEKLMRLLESPAVTVPVPPAYQNTPQPTAPVVAPAPAPAQPPQVAMSGLPEVQVISDEVSFAVTNTFGVRAWKPKVGFIPWWEGATITYEVGATISRTNNEVMARTILMAIIDQFHKADGGSFAGKNQSDSRVHDELVLAFGEAKKKVLRGNPGWEHMFIHPRYWVNTSTVSDGRKVATQ